MGSCCFTPRRTQFLWWYWLLLASIVGIPMFLACWYVARHKAADDEQKAQLGKKASRIFWYSTYLTAALTVFAVSKIHDQMSPSDTGWSPNSSDPHQFSLSHLIILVVAYVGGVALLTAAANRRRKWLLLYAIPPVLFFLGGWILLIHPSTPANFLLSALSLLAAGAILRQDNNSAMGVGLLFVPLVVFLLVCTVYSAASLAELLLLVAACMLPAHLCARFSVDPSQRSARNALFMLVLGAFLFWGATKYARVGNLYVYYLVRGRVPDTYDVTQHMNNGF